MSSFAYFFKESVRGFTRNISTTLGSIITIFLSLLIIGVFFVVGIVVDNVVSSVENQVSITAFVSDSADEPSVDQVMGFARGIDGVSSVEFTTKDQALENFRNMSNSPEILDQLDGQNPLPASIDIELSDPQKVSQVAEELEANETFQLIAEDPANPGESIKFGKKSVDRMFMLTNYIRYIGIALIALLVFIAMIFINNTIRLAILARRKEIAIMRLVGASNGFIRGPFLMEGSLHAVVGALLAIGSIELVRQLVLPQVIEQLPWLPIDVSTQTYLFIYLILLVSGIVIGLIGSALAMRRYLKV